MSEAERFFDYYESNGWRVGKNPMRSWIHAIGNWKRNYEEKRALNSPKKTIHHLRDSNYDASKDA